MSCIEITPADFDNMHHALGRPADPLAETYRNYFVIDRSNPDCAQFEATGCWEEKPPINLGRSRVFRVTDDGKSALADWLRLQRPPQITPSGGAHDASTKGDEVGKSDGGGS